MARPARVAGGLMAGSGLTALAVTDRPIGLDHGLAGGKAAGGPRSEIVPIVGTLVHNAKMTPDKVVEMRQRFAAGETIYELGPVFGISAQTAAQVIRRETWKHVLDGAPIPPRSTHRKLTREQVTTIRMRHAHGTSGARLARDYHVSRAAISMIVNRKTHA